MFILAAKMALYKMYHVIEKKTIAAYPTKRTFLLKKPSGYSPIERELSSIFEVSISRRHQTYAKSLKVMADDKNIIRDLS